ncbi:MAG: hypothetical protein KME30_03430 [Iphinoe sp. HA4291-MV1]|nr:hypothetical protein [Iphinoe sp. HA4291-MV1]
MPVPLLCRESPSPKRDAERWRSLRFALTGTPVASVGKAIIRAVSPLPCLRDGNRHRPWRLLRETPRANALRVKETNLHLLFHE